MWRPLLRFALLGVALFAADRLWRSAPPAETLVVPAARAAAVREALARTLGRDATAAELEGALAGEVEEALLVREALAHGWERDDPVVFRRLVQNLRFAGAAPEQDDAALFAQALAMDLHRTDAVVRRRLAQRMRLALEEETDPPDEAALREYHARHRDRYHRPARTRLTQLFFTAEHEAEARSALGRLRSADVPADAARELGDPFLHPAEQPLQTHRELEARFGSAFADAALALAPGAWSGPVRSAYGVHLVRVHEREPARTAGLDEVRDAVRHALVAERRRAALERGLAGLREGVAVEVGREPDAS